jgi:FkbM family methyltransferase
LCSPGKGKHMTAVNWSDYIRSKADFYSTLSPRARRDGEFTWNMTGRPPTWRRHFKKMPVLGRMYVERRLRLQNPITHLEDYSTAELSAIYEARSLLADEVSRIMFDEAVVLRMVSCHRYFVMRNAFEDLAIVEEEKPFSSEGLPEKYQGLPIKEFRLGVSGRDIRVVAADEFPSMLNKWQQYFVKRDGLDFRPRTGDTVLDCGACVGDVSTVFAAMVGQSGRVFGFDPVPLHIRFCELQRAMNPALSNTLRFIQKAVGNDNRAASNSKDRLEISPGEFDISNFGMTTIDSFVSEAGVDRVDFVKMDIEGAERDALVGAATTIKTLRPKLAISTYHRPDDFWMIPLQIRDMGLDYKFAFGHHSPKNWESVIYAY